ncbi:agamous-like MADS-box protein AGL65 [Herrania umbratica]|uniref:Agamous-like MADS-box protein AGL65 n=1 Tax=Herrania umbratica TaxID=108875 RepID=A0A6J0ZS33_9ROSI|nr:agamous-like MADS-box protein AGL65 [Herrania umbratica]
MGRGKLKIQRLESAKARQTKYSKRKAGLVKKAKELAILCDVDLALLLFSPADRPTLLVGQDKDLSAVVERLSKLSLEEREERRAYTMKVLTKFYENSDSEADPRNVSEDRSNVLKLHEDQLKELKEKLAEKSKILRDWKYPQNVEDLSQLKIMEEHLIAYLNGIRNKKCQLAMEQLKGQEGLEGTK